MSFMPIFVPDLFLKERPIIGAHSFPLPLCSWTAITGASGIGKTTLLRFFVGLNKKVASPFLRETVSYMPQTSSLLPFKNAIQNIFISDSLKGKKPNLDLAHRLLNEVELFAFRHYYPYQLSVGMQKRISLAQALYLERPFVFMDEPFSGLDPKTREAMHDLCQLAFKNKTVVFVTHDEIDIKALSTTALVLEGYPATLH